MDWFWELDNGSLPAWLSLVAALGAGGIALRNLMHDRSDRRKIQADKIGCWWGTHDDVRTGASGRQTVTTWHSALVRNASALPVHDVRVHFDTPGRERMTVELPLLGPTSAPQPVYPPKLDPSEQAAVLVEGSMSFDVSMEFRDSAGRRWHRREDGELIQRRP